MASRVLAGQRILLLRDEGRQDVARLAKGIRAAGVFVDIVDPIRDRRAAWQKRPDARWVVVALSPETSSTTLARARATYQEARLLVLGPLPDSLAFVAAQVGADSYLTTPVLAKDILDWAGAHLSFNPRSDYPGFSSAREIRLQHRKRLQWLVESIATEFALSRREIQTIHAAARGKSTKTIAADLAVSGKTVEYFWQRVYDKLNCRSQLEVLAVLLDRAL